MGLFDYVNLIYGTSGKNTSGYYGIPTAKLLADNSHIFGPDTDSSSLCMDEFMGENTNSATMGASPEASAYFSNETVYLNSKQIHHNTVLLDNIEQDLGLYEITSAEYSYLRKNNPEELMKTQYKIVNGHGQIGHQWCAHTVSYYSKQAGINIGSHKASVQEFINWAGKDYKSIKMKRMNANNYEAERYSRINQIEQQLPQMKEGDFILWKTNDCNNNRGSYAVRLPDGSIKVCERSHIGIIESVDVERGIVTVIEGNANECIVPDNAERSLVQTDFERVNGDQVIGEFQEVNRRDGLIRKEYSVYELACFGYTGFIDNSSRVPVKNEAD